jgi:hypothetical protein
VCLTRKDKTFSPSFFSRKKVGEKKSAPPSIPHTQLSPSPLLPTTTTTPSIFDRSALPLRMTMLVPKTLYFVFGVHPCFAIVGPRKKKNHWSGRGSFFFALRGLSRFLSLSLLRNNKKKGSVTAEKAKKKREDADISE